MRNLYDVLGASIDETKEQIQRRFRRLSKKLHPDMGGDKDKFDELSLAWEVLDRIRIPLFSSGVWSKMQLHTRGNIDGYLRATGPKKLRMSASSHSFVTVVKSAPSPLR